MLNGLPEIRKGRISCVKIIQAAYLRRGELPYHFPGGQPLIASGGELFSSPTSGVKLVVTGLHQPVDLVEGIVG